MRKNSFPLFLLPLLLTGCGGGDLVVNSSTSVKRSSSGGSATATASSLTGRWTVKLAKGGAAKGYVDVSGQLDCQTGGVLLLLPQPDGKTNLIRAEAGKVVTYTNRLAPSLGELRAVLEADPGPVTDNPPQSNGGKGARRLGKATDVRLFLEWSY